jgi:hypothetical protein
MELLMQCIFFKNCEPLVKEGTRIACRGTSLSFPECPWVVGGSLAERLWETQRTWWIMPAGIKCASGFVKEELEYTSAVTTKSCHYDFQIQQ